MKTEKEVWRRIFNPQPFKIGDRVRIERTFYQDSEHRRGKIGTIVQVLRLLSTSSPYGYMVATKTYPEGLFYPKRDLTLV